MIDVPGSSDNNRFHLLGILPEQAIQKPAAVIAERRRSTNSESWRECSSQLFALGMCRFFIGFQDDVNFGALFKAYFVAIFRRE